MRTFYVCGWKKIKASSSLWMFFFSNLDILNEQVYIDCIFFPRNPCNCLREIFFYHESNIVRCMHSFGMFSIKYLRSTTFQKTEEFGNY